MTAVRLKCLAPRPMATLRLLCIAYAGGGAQTFRGWAALLPPHVEAFAVQLPGREDRLGQPALQDWAAMFDAVTAALMPLPCLPTAVFGHSLGAVIALELARWMQAKHPGRLRHLLVSGRRWPGGGGPEPANATQADDLSDDALLCALDRQYGSLSTSLAHPEIRQLALPILRADLRLLQSYRYAAAPLLDCALTVLAGCDDPSTCAQNLAGWRQETAGPFRIRMLDGGHFFIDSHRAQVVAQIVADLGDAIGAGSVGDAGDGAMPGRQAW